MSVEIRIPTLGESIVEATIAAWLKHEGDSVSQGEAVAELETDKVNIEVTADQGGILQKIMKQEGETVTVDEVIGMIDDSAAASPQPSTAATDGQRVPTGPLQAALEISDGQRPPSPLARRIAADHNIDISQVKTANPHGRVTREDVFGYMTQQAAPSPTKPAVAASLPAPMPPLSMQQVGASKREERVRLSRRRQTIAQRLVETQHTAAMLTTFNEIDMSAVIEIRSRRKEAFKERHNVSLGFMSFFTKAVVGALKAFPRLNAEIQGNEMVLKHYYDIGIAVGVEEGLVVPVLRDADRKSFAAIESEIAELAKKARGNTLSLAELQGGTFTITNGGVYGSLMSTPILNGPQVGILGMHKIEQRPVVVKGEIVIRPMMYVALSYDHRIVDGGEAVQFLVRVKELVEDPETLLLEG
ncbi:MAG: 2-oxoglutarate dehydrogenase complex dihydrolipoyllysine-residue succinyltransferase [Ktedonobacteraceae bacterium]